MALHALCGVHTFPCSYVHAKETCTILAGTTGNNSQIQERTQSLFCDSLTQQIRCNQPDGNHSSSGNKDLPYFLHRITTLWMVWNSLVYRHISQYTVICLISECFHSFIYILVSQGYGLDAVKNTFIHNTFIHPLPHNQQYIQTEQFLNVSTPNDMCA